MIWNTKACITFLDDLDLNEKRFPHWFHNIYTINELISFYFDKKAKRGVNLEKYQESINILCARQFCKNKKKLHIDIALYSSFKHGVMTNELSSMHKK